MPQQLTIDPDAERRRDFMAGWYPKAISELGGRANEKPLDEMDVRDCPNAIYADVSAALDAKLARLSADNAALKELRLSDAALSRLDRLGFSSPSHPVGRDEPQADAPDFDDAPLPECVR